MTTVRESQTAVVVPIVAGLIVGSLLALESFSLLRSGGVDTLFALWLAVMAFFFGVLLVSTVIRIVFGVAFLWRRRR